MDIAACSLTTQNFTPPPGELPLELALDFHLKENPDYPALIHPAGKDGRNLKFCTYSELVPAIHRAGHWISSALNFLPGATKSHPPPVVALLLKTDNVTYLTVLAGLMRAGITAFPISPRFSGTVVANLLQTAQPQAVVVSSGTQRLANEALAEYAKADAVLPVLHEVPALHSLYPGHEIYDALPFNGRQLNDITILTHSSSSSSLFPKVIPWSSNTVIHHGEIKDYPVHKFPGRVLGAFGLELFHSLGMCIFFTMVRRGLILGVLDPWESTSILPANLEDIFRGFEIVRPDFFLTTPRAIELWAEDTEKIEILRKSAVNLVYGGRFLSKTVGDKLVKYGVRICSTYGSTETGPITLLPHFQGDDWEYWTVYPRSDLKFISRDDGLLELIVTVQDASDYLPVSNTTLGGKPAYNPGDLFIAHPNKRHTYKIFGRSSDQIMLATGEMVNPIDIESELTSHSLVASAVMFGHTRFAVGLIVEQQIVGEEGSLSGEGFINKIWPIISEYNRLAPSYARISRKMIIVATPDRPILVSPKGLPRRPIVWHDYQDEIDALYVDEVKITA